MRDIAARTRAGLTERYAAPAAADPRVYVDRHHLRRLEGPAKALRLLPRQPSGSVLNGRHASRLRGRGLNFEELRSYLPGDDIRSIDWKVTARTREPHVRVYTEERDRPALVVLDQRMSMFFGSALNMKSVTAAEAAAIAAFTILDQGDRIGGIVFGDTQIAEVRPLASRRALDAFITAAARANAALGPDVQVAEPMSLNRPLEAAARIAHTNHLVIVISDFDGIDARTETLIGGLAQHNDVVLCLVTDPLAHDTAERLNVVVSDGRLQAQLDARSDSARQALNAFFERRFGEILKLEKSMGVPVLPLSAGEATLPQIRRLLGHPPGRR